MKTEAKRGGPSAAKAAKESFESRVRQLTKRHTIDRDVLLGLLDEWGMERAVEMLFLVLLALDLKVR